MIVAQKLTSLSHPPLLKQKTPLVVHPSYLLVPWVSKSKALRPVRRARSLKKSPFRLAHVATAPLLKTEKRKSQVAIVEKMIPATVPLDTGIPIATERKNVSEAKRKIDLETRLPHQQSKILTKPSEKSGIAIDCSRKLNAWQA